MAAMYEIPGIQSHGGGRNRGFSHTRKSAAQMDPSTFAAMSGATTMNINAGFSTSTPKAPEFHHHSTSSTDTVRAMQQPPSHLSLPVPPSFSSPSMERSKSWERRKSVGLPSHLTLQGPKQGVTAAGDRKLGIVTHEKRTWGMMSNEVLSALLISLPYAITSWAYGFGLVPALSCTPKPPDHPKETAYGRDQATSISLGDHLKMVEFACGFTSLTLLLVGLWGLYRQRSHSTGRRKSHDDLSEKVKRKGTVLLARSAIARILSVGLPFYAASTLGVRVALVMLAAVASDTIAWSPGSTSTSAKAYTRFAGQRKFTFIVFLIQMGSDVLGLTNRLATMSILHGYLALGLSILFMPPPFSPHAPKMSAILATSPEVTYPITWEGPPSTKGLSSSLSSGPSPLIATNDDTYLTLCCGAISGGAAGLLSVILDSSAGAILPRNVFGGVAAASVAALSLTSADTHFFKESRGVGFLIGSFAACFAAVLTHNEWVSFAYQGALVVASLVALKLDAHFSSSHKHPSHHQHTHQHSQTKIHPGEYGPVSRFTEALLLRLRGWPLLHNIIAEKDSRRIFYFMWYVL